MERAGSLLTAMSCKKTYFSHRQTMRKCRQEPNIYIKFPTSTLAEQLDCGTRQSWKSKHTKGKFPIKILIKINPSTQSSVTNC